MQIVDAQVHAHERDHPGRPWIGHLHGLASATGDEMVAAMDAAGVDGALLVSPYSFYRYRTELSRLLRTLCGDELVPPCSTLLFSSCSYVQMLEHVAALDR